MRTSVAAAGSAAFFVAAPGVVAGVIPWALTGWERGSARPEWVWVPAGAVGAVLIAVGVLVLVRAFAAFVTRGAGTPAPVAPTERLVVGGLYRHVRNPMYVAVLAIVVGQALVLVRPSLLLYAGAAGAAMVAFVRGYEEPTLRLRFGAQYEEFCREVPGWWPRWRLPIG